MELPSLNDFFPETLLPSQVLALEAQRRHHRNSAEMEEKDFGWLCRVLTSPKVKVNVAETVLFQSDTIDLWIYTDESGGLRKRPLGEESVKSPLDACRYFLSKAQLVPSHTAPVCLLISKFGRTAIDMYQFDSLPDRKDLFMKLIGVQEYKEAKGAQDAWHNYHIRFEGGHGYSSTFVKVRHNGVREPENSARLLHKAKDVVTVILSAIEESKLKRVLELAIDLIIDTENVLWVINSSVCVVGPPGCSGLTETVVSTNNSKEKPQRTVVKPTISKPRKHTHSEIKGDSKPAVKVTFKRGQLRSVDSNLNTPLRILSPSYSRGSPVDPSSPTQPHFDLQHYELLQSEITNSLSQTIDSSMKLSVPPARNKSFLAKPIPTRQFFNPNFQEMLVMNFLKKQGIAQFDHIAFQEEFYRELEASETAELSPGRSGRRPTQQKADGTPMHDAIISDSSISEGSQSSNGSERKQEEQKQEKLPPIRKKPMKRFNVTRRQLYGKVSRDTLLGPIRPVLSRSKQLSLPIRFKREGIQTVRSHPGTFPNPEKISI